MTIRVNANLFRIADMCRSTEETRYYLNGVYVEPHAVQGVNLVTTDGHRMLVVYDETGHADAPAIVQLNKDMLKACKPGKGELRRELHVEGTEARVMLVEKDHDADRNPIETATPTTIQTRCLVDGTFPDWRRVIPKYDDMKNAAPWFNGSYLADFGKIGKELTPDSRGGTAMTVLSSDAGGPALIRWFGIAHAFGILMPIRGSDIQRDGLPTFLNARPQNNESAAA